MKHDYRSWRGTGIRQGRGRKGGGEGGHAPYLVGCTAGIDEAPPIHAFIIIRQLVMDSLLHKAQPRPLHI